MVSPNECDFRRSGGSDSGRRKSAAEADGARGDEHPEDHPPSEVINDPRAQQRRDDGGEARDKHEG